MQDNQQIPDTLPIRSRQQAGPGTLVFVPKRDGPPEAVRITAIVRVMPIVGSGAWAMPTQPAFLFLVGDTIINPLMCWPSARDCAHEQLSDARNTLNFRRESLSESEREVAMLEAWLQKSGLTLAPAPIDPIDQPDAGAREREKTDMLLHEAS